MKGIITDTEKTSSKPMSIYFAAPRFDFSLNQKPKPDSFYLKDVIVCAFDLQFPGVDIVCGRCKHSYHSYGWQPPDKARVIQDIDGIVYLLQKKYKCGCQTTKVGITIIQDPDENVPDFMRCSYPIRCYHRSAVTEKFLNPIVHDATTGKSFHEIADGINTRRAEEYLRCHAMYSSFVQYYLQLERTKKDFFGANMASVDTPSSSTNSDRSQDVGEISDSSYPSFSAMDDNKGYNGDFNIPAETIIADYIGKLILPIVPNLIS